ncbi:protein FAM110D-like [Protopterus annectens]|uniref:protein FAM110D-like n=1 Tax=Protopterus annectens TaxID=7888 RepID=UPI001CFC0988|nr:protein FAM110D-like [Protopterus annectens]
MKPISPIGSPPPLRLLNKGPEYLRRQIDSGNRGQVISAVERLEADKAKYVKTQEVRNTRQEPVIMPYATPPPCPRNIHYSAPPCPRNKPTYDSISHVSSCKENQHLEEADSAPKVTQQTPILRRSTGKRMMRPDSLIMYRQKRDCKTVNKENTKGYSLVRWLFQGSLKEKTVAIPEALLNVKDKGTSRGEYSTELPSPETLSPRSCNLQLITLSPAATPSVCRHRISISTHSAKKPIELPIPRPREPHSDPCWRNSLAVSEKERFFNYCGLDADIVEHFGMANFLPATSDTASLMFRSISSAGSAGEEMSHSSDDGMGLMEDELKEQIPSVVSIIERNARVIKWLYSCRKAKDTSKESTV